MASSIWPFRAGSAEVVIGLGKIGFQADGFLKLADCLVDLAFPEQGGAEVVIGLGKIGFQADGFLKLADGFVNLAFLSRAVPRLLWLWRNRVSGG